MKLTRMVGVVAVGIAVLTANVPHANGGDLWDRLFKRRQKTANEQPAALLPQTTSAKPAAASNGSASVTPLIQAQYQSQGPASSSSPGSAVGRETIPVLTLDEALRTAESRQPQLVAAAAAVDAARGRYRQAGTYPNPSLDVRGETLLETQVVAGVSQPIILGARRERAMDATCRDIEVREREFDALRARVSWGVKQAFYEVVGLQQLITLAREQEQNAQSLVEKMQERFKQGDVAERDVLLRRSISPRSAFRPRTSNVP